MAMDDKRSSRYSPTSRMNNLPKLGGFTSPIGQTNGSKNLGVFASAPDHVSALPGLSPTLERRNNHRSQEQLDGHTKWTIRLRRLPRNFGLDALRSMLIFAKDLDETKFVDPDNLSIEDHGFQCAVATFHSEAGALEVLERLNGKPNATKDANMIIELMPAARAINVGPRRNTVDYTASRQQNSSGSSSSSDNPLSRQSSRFSSSFHNMSKVSPPLGSPTAITHDFPIPDSSNSIQGLFSPQSPVANSHSDFHRVSGKSVINDGLEDDETGELLKDPVGYAKNGRVPSASFGNPLPQFGNLSLNTGAVNASPHYMSSPASTGFASPQSMQSPTLQPSSRALGAGPNGSYPARNRHDYPPVNPADQNPPCNTLYVGNLPVNTSEDELKSIFSKSRGFKRLMFRTKQQGPMCFVEFEDVHYASHALNELYGVNLHNSYKGGIRISFSKNPLGVRSDRNNTAMGSNNSGYNNGMSAPPGFSTANGPPPGLNPPGVRSPPPYGASPVQNGAGRGYAPRYAGIAPQGRPQQGINGHMSASSNSHPGQFSYAPNFGSMNGAFMDYPNLNGSGYNIGR